MKREDWFEPALNIHTALSPTIITIFCICPLSAQKLKLLFLGIKNIWGICPPCPPPQATPMM